MIYRRAWTRHSASWPSSIPSCSPGPWVSAYRTAISGRRGGDAWKVADIFAVFQNYWSAVLANLLVIVIVVLGFIFLIVPGIIFACKLAFVSYLVVDRKMEAVEAVKESWRMTTGHAWTIFFMGLLAIPIALIGLVCLIVGIIPAIWWIGLAMASLYHAVSEGEAGQQSPSDMAMES